MVVNLNIYQEWGTKLPYRAIATLIDYPYEAFISSIASPILIPFMLLGIFFLFGYFLLTKTIELRPIRLFNRSKGSLHTQSLNTHTFNSQDSNSFKWFYKAPVSILLIGILFLLIRSGWQTTPLNPSMAYFSTRPILNHAAVNTEWNLLSDFLRNRKASKNPYEVMDDKTALKDIKPYLNLSTGTSAPLSILNQERPNIVLLILESFTSDLIKSLGGEANITPNFEKLVKDGLLFTNIYASGDRTDKGIISIMSAFPSQATQSIIKNVNKLEKLPGFSQELLENGYKTSFFYGGESEFYNFKSYMLSHGIQKVIDQHNFPRKDVLSKWGAFDHLTLNKQLNYLNKSPQPFFSTLLTLSNHEPFDLPTLPKFGSNSLANLFRSTAFYTDSALFDYINKAKQTDWYKNTLFILIADHGHRLPTEKWDSFHPNRYRIPMLFYGDVIKEEFRGKEIDKIGGQTDLASTLLHQVNISAEKYFWSKDLLDPKTPSFSFFSWDNGFGVVTPEQSLTYDNTGKTIVYLKNPAIQDSTNQKLNTVGQAYLQETFKQFLEY